MVVRSVATMEKLKVEKLADSLVLQKEFWRVALLVNMMVDWMVDSMAAMLVFRMVDW